ncbi:XkdX family protein [Bacillus sp. YC2]|uniref:XkdX family protein n=1 Tax=Bacillus sp. YC2 TaxID=2861287 RepID=UPI001CA6D066|nr:XkdX family protein [Bacillus sp. YC2]MBY8913324.1 XkdX family protein [Bacillus sp. YC2]
MDWFKSIRACFNWGCYSPEDVREFVQYNKITENQYEEIVNSGKTIVADEQV